MQCYPCLELRVPNEVSNRHAATMEDMGKVWATEAVETENGDTNCGSFYVIENPSSLPSLHRDVDDVVIFH
jgi:hypothetical protein